MDAKERRKRVDELEIMCDECMHTSGHFCNYCSVQKEIHSIVGKFNGGVSGLL